MGNIKGVSNEEMKYGETSSLNIGAGYVTLVTITSTESIRVKGMLISMVGTTPPTNGAVLTFRWYDGTSVVGDTWTWVVGTDADQMPVSDIEFSVTLQLQCTSDQAGDNATTFPYRYVEEE